MADVTHAARPDSPVSDHMELERLGGAWRQTTAMQAQGTLFPCMCFSPLNIYFLCFARTQFPSHMQNRLFWGAWERWGEKGEAGDSLAQGT